MSNQACQRIIALIDMDCFYCQVEARIDPSLKGKPVAVVQYNQWKGGGIIAVNYEARNKGVTRGMRGSQAQEKCPGINLVSVPCVRGKADLTKYREAGEEVAEVFSTFSDCVQRASIDEAYIDLTKAVNERIKSGVHEVTPGDLGSTYVVGFCDLKSNNLVTRSRGVVDWLKQLDNQQSLDSPDFKLAVGALIVEEMRAQVLSKTGFHCSAGIAHNKILAKLVAGLHKPKCQTVLPHDGVPELYDTLPVYKVRNLGGKLGKLVSNKLSINFMSELYKFSLQELQQKFDEKTGSWLYNIARGVDSDPVTPRLIPESIGCCKNFPGLNALKTVTVVKQWLNELATEISERLGKDIEKNKRRAKLLTVSFYQETPMSRSGNLNSYETTAIANDAFNLLKKFNNASQSSDAWNPPIKFLGLSVSKFENEQGSIGKYLKSIPASKESVKPNRTSPEKSEPSVSKIDSDKTASQKPQSSFFLRFLQKKEIFDDNKMQEDSEDEEINENLYISLSEVFPNLNEADDDVVELLPKEMKEKYKERVNPEVLNDKPSTSASLNKPSTSASLDKPSTSAGLNKPETELCNECKKNIPIDEFLEHLDYHAAVKLHAEINRSGNTQPKNPTEKIDKNKVVEKSVEKNKRKKHGNAKTVEKKMKSITSFFSVVPKS